MNTKDPQVLTAVDFLAEVYQKGHTNTELRQYLFHRRRMNTTQIDQAFEIHAARVRAAARTQGEGERPEVTKSTSKSLKTEELSFLLPANREKGKELLKNFLMTEFNYNNVLTCLNEEYYTHLCDLSDRGKIQIKRKEIEPMFHRIPQLVKFHKAFYLEMVHRKANFGQYFVRQFNGFREYLEYAKDCNFSTKKMREYLFDKKLRKALDQARMISRRPKDDLMDLLLSPLDRIKTYKNFINSFRDWADKTQTSEFDFLEKASRRIGRIVTAIGMYKHTIINRNEMNKVQQFLDKQCTIISPSRRIVRRGLMTRRTTTWPVRNKHYVFFLFNDVLLWTSKKGELQNLVFLRDCELKPSESKNSPERKFEVIANGTTYKYHKHLKLECREIRQRDQWFKAMEKEIVQWKVSKISKVNTTTSPMEQELANYIEKQAESNPDYLTPPPDTENTVDNKSKEVAEANVNQEFEEEIINPGHRRYQHSMNFEAKDFNENFLAIDDMSVTSESEQEHMVMDHQKYGNSMGALFPNVTGRKEESKETSQESINRIQVQDGRTEIFSRGSFAGSRLPERDSRPSWRLQPRPNSEDMSSSSIGRIERSKKTNNIRRGAKSVENLRRLSSCTISLNEFI